MLNTLVAGIVIGFVGCLYYVATKKQKASKGDKGEAVKGQSVFLNFLILDKTEAIQAGVEAKLSEKIGSGYFRDKFKKNISKVAANKISDETVANKMSAKMIEMMPSKLFEMGLVATAAKAYGKGSFFVVKLTIISADVQKLLDKVAGQEKASRFEEVMNILGGQWARESLSDSIVPIICSKIQNKLPVKLKETFEEKGLHCDITVKPDTEEAEFFFSCIAEDN